MSPVPVAEARTSATACSIMLYSHANRVVSTRALWKRNLCGNYGNPFCMHFPSSGCWILVYFWEVFGRTIKTLGRELIISPFLGRKFFLRLKNNVFFLSIFIFYLLWMQMRSEWEKWENLIDSLKCWASSLGS